MGFIKEQFLSVIEWQEFRNDQIFYKWKQNEIKNKLTI